jgi:hypothetical protein
VFYRVGEAVGGWEATGSGGDLLLIGFEGVKGEEETERRRLDGGNEESGVPVRFGYSRVEESSRRWRTARRRGRRGRGADGSQRWETTP